MLDQLLPSNPYALLNMPKPADITWDNKIKAYLLPSDVLCMRGTFNLSKNEDVAKFLDMIYTQVGKMPLQMEPHS